MATDDSSNRPSAFSVYASRFLAGKLSSAEGRVVDQSQIFRPSSPGSPSHDPFLPSPGASQSHPRLAGSSNLSVGEHTPPFPGPGIEALPDIDAGGIASGMASGMASGVGMGLLFDSPDPPEATRFATAPNPYEASSDDEEEADLDQVNFVRRSLLRPQIRNQSSSKVISERSKKGWLAHQSIFPPSSSSSDDSDSEKETEADSEDESRMIGRVPLDNNSQLLSPSELYRVTQPTTLTSDDLNEPLLDTSGRGTIPVRLQVYHGRFGHWEREGLRKYKDSGFLALWLTSLLAVLIGLCFVWGPTENPPEGAPERSSILPLLPFLFLMSIPAFLLPPAFLYLLRQTVRPVLTATAVAIPFSLFVCGWWAFGASFDASGLDGVDVNERWWSTTGMRIGALILWSASAWFARLVWIRRKRLERTVAVVELSTNLLLSHPPLLLLTPLLLAIFAITSIPFLTMIIRLGMIGYWRHPRENTWVFHLRPYAGWLIFLVGLVWVWTWGVIRGVGRVAVAGVVGEWYFHRENQADPLEVTVAAVHRATGTSLGSIALGSLIVAVLRMVGRSAAAMRRWTSPRTTTLPPALSFLGHLTPVFSIIAGVLDQLNGYALVYVGITGEAFWPSARRAVGLASRKRGGHLLDYTFIKLLLTLSSTALAMFTATAGYLYMTHAVANPGYAPIAGLLCGGIPFLAIRAGAAVLGDAADALFICHQIDREAGGGHCDEAKKAFAGETRGDSAV